MFWRTLPASALHTGLLPSPPSPSSIHSSYIPFTPHPGDAVLQANTRGCQRARALTQDSPYPRPLPGPTLPFYIPSSQTDQHWPEEAGNPLHSLGHPHLSEDEE